MNENTQQTTTQTPEGTGGKMFTQDEVNKIVSDRLAREREKLADGSEYKAKYEAVQKELCPPFAAGVLAAPGSLCPPAPLRPAPCFPFSSFFSPCSILPHIYEKVCPSADFFDRL